MSQVFVSSQYLINFTPFSGAGGVLMGSCVSLLSHRRRRRRRYLTAANKTPQAGPSRE